MNYYRNEAFSTPQVVKNLIIINILFFMAQTLLPNGIGGQIEQTLALHSVFSEKFHIYQLLSYMFLHADFTHLFMNMFAFWMFGRTLEHELGSRRFLNYYLLTGIGAGALHLGINYLEVVNLESAIMESGIATEQMVRSLAMRANAITIGASGAVFGILLAFGMMHPNSIIMLMIPPIPMKAKWFVIIYGVLELFLGVAHTSDGVAHFAHVGGMLFGFLLLRYWKHRGDIYY